MSTRRIFLVLSAALTALGYARIRQPILTWGATDTEAAGPLPGDELLPAAGGASTRAIDIDAPPADVWPWLAQMGPSPRGGAYTYDWIENLLGLEMHSVDRVLPEFQRPGVGDTIELGSNRMRLRTGRAATRARLALRRRELALDVRARGPWREDEADQPNRFRLRSLAARIGMLPMEPGSLVMERRMLREIKRLSEGLAREAEDRTGGERTQAAGQS